MTASAYVLGVDPSLTGTGVARINQDGTVAVRHFGRKGRRDETLVQRVDRIRAIVAELAEWAQVEPDDPDSETWADRGLPALVVIETAAHSRTGGSTWDRAGLWWAIAWSSIGRDGERVAQCAPTTRARWATGTGRADKAAVSSAVSRLWPDVDIDCENCADALALATIGAQHLGWDVPTLQRHLDALGAVTWPEEAA